MAKFEIPDDASHPNTLRSLIRMRAELAGECEHLQRKIRNTIVSMDHIDATLRLLDPNLDLGQVGFKPVPPRSVAPKGEVTRVILQALRTADAPMKTTELADELMRKRGIDPADESFRRVMVKRTGACLRKLKIKGLVEALPTNEHVSTWKVVRRAKH